MTSSSFFLSVTTFGSGVTVQFLLCITIDVPPSDKQCCGRLTGASSPHCGLGLSCSPEGGTAGQSEAWPGVGLRFPHPLGRPCGSLRFSGEEDTFLMSIPYLN